MQDNQKDQKTITDNKNDKQNQGSENNQDTQKKSSNLPEKSSPTGEDKNVTPSHSEVTDKEHPHEYKTPVGEKNRTDESEDESESKRGDEDKTQSSPKTSGKRN